jgi:hypothetical protein
VAMELPSALAQQLTKSRQQQSYTADFSAADWPVIEHNSRESAGSFIRLGKNGKQRRRSTKQKPISNYAWCMYVRSAADLPVTGNIRGKSAGKLCCCASLQAYVGEEVVLE